MITTTKCVLCGFEEAKAQYFRDDSTNYSYTRCPNCGEYWHPIYDRRVSDNRPKGKNAVLLSGLARELTDRVLVDREKTDEILNIHIFTYQEIADRNNVLNLLSHSTEDLLLSPLIPNSPTEKLNKLLLWLFRKTEFFGQSHKVVLSAENNRTNDKKFYMKSICYAANDTEFNLIIKAAEDYGYITTSSNINHGNYFLTLKGHEYCQEIEQKGVNTNNVFVAMWFNNEVDSAYDEAIRPAIDDECGYHAVKINMKEHNNDINDEIIAGIRDSKFMVADLSGYRGGVYFEVGYAKGLGKEVILTCCKDWFDGEKDSEGKWLKEAVHFDINHLNTIVWETTEELKKNLTNRISATIGAIRPRV